MKMEKRELEILEYFDGGIYAGDIVNELPHGHGVLTWPDGKKYWGNFENGVPYGPGVVTWPDNTRDRACFDKGRLIYPDGIKHRGIIEGECPDGYGFSRQCEFQYEGFWEDDEPHGYGICLWTDGVRYEGYWKNGERNGYGVMTLSDGTRYEGEWENDELCEQNDEVRSDIRQYEDEFENDKSENAAKLHYRTRGNSTPQGKPRVYYTGHPADLDAYAEEIFADILKSQNCAIWYDKEPETLAGREEWQRELMQMQLIVIPVTSRFLYQPNRARDVEFPFAMEHHIPVLPLIQEEGLESVFNETCGDLQMLNRRESDPTALSYEEKLEKFLSSVLVGDELVEKVRAAFDAYVFLSYRKKDRKYAQELMRLIHKNDFCRDIAIWYDEFLTPGENFNEAIGEALKKCALFALAVTPNIVENGNYVMTIEYPEAQKEGKPILPMEMESTDKEKLQNSFRDIPPCVDAHDEPALSAALLETLQRLAIRENDGSPKHDFFIGLAYLDGIDVEVDRARALALITGAAENGLPEAVQKLVTMYRSGGGVERNYRAAIGWQERLADLRKTQYEQSGTEYDGLSWVKELETLGDYHKEAADVTAAGEVYQQLLDISTRLIDLYDSAEAKRGLLIGNSRMGDISLSEGRLTEAKKYYGESLVIGGMLFAEKETAESKRDLAVCYDKMGDISKAEKRPREASEYYQKSLRLTEQLYEESKDAQVRRALFVSYENMGNVGRLASKELEEYYLKGLELAKQLYEETRTAGARRDLAVGYGHLGDFSRDEGMPAQAEAYYRKTLELCKQVFEEKGTVEARRDLFGCFERLGYLCKSEGRLAEAKEYYLKSEELAGQLCWETQTAEDRQNLFVIYVQLGDISREEGDLEEAKTYYQKSMRLSALLDGEETVRRKLSLVAYKLQEINEPYESSYEGSLENGRPDDLRYEGSFKNGKKSGYGVQIWPDGHRYEGSWKNDLPDGQGIMTWPDGLHYEGSFRKGFKEGRGVQTWSDGLRFEGEWEYDEPSQGAWTAPAGGMILPDGSRYEGDLENGRPHGQGVMIWPDGERYEGSFRNGMRDGHGVVTYPVGLRSEGEWKNDKAVGKGVWTTLDGSPIALDEEGEGFSKL